MHGQTWTWHRIIGRCLDQVTDPICGLRPPCINDDIDLLRMSTDSRGWVGSAKPGHFLPAESALWSLSVIPFSLYFTIQVDPQVLPVVFSLSLLLQGCSNWCSYNIWLNMTQDNIENTTVTIVQRYSVNFPQGSIHMRSKTTYSEPTAALTKSSSLLGTCRVGKMWKAAMTGAIWLYIRSSGKIELSANYFPTPFY